MSKKLSVAGIFCSLGARKVFCWMPDKTYIKILFFLSGGGQRLNLENPKTFNEKLQWLKLYDRNPEYIRMVDKYAVKEYIAGKIGEEYVIPTLGVWDRFDEIDFESLPDQFVLKCTHDSGSTVICKSKAEFDYKAARKKINKLLKRNYYWVGREWPYKDVKPCVIAEKYMEESQSDLRHSTEEIEKNLTDYKFFCFDGKPRIVYISKDHAVEPKTDFFDMDFKHLPIRMRDQNSDVPPPKPSNFDKMKEIAKVLSKDIPHLRVDFYSVDEKIYVGELTFYHCSGFMTVTPKEWNDRMGGWIDLPNETER